MPVAFGAPVLGLAPGDIFVNHRIEATAGRGAMGIVYRATDLDLERVVALKLIAPAFVDDPGLRARFVAESRAAAAIEHPHVIPVYYAGEGDGVMYIVMRYVDGPDLRALVRAAGRLDCARAARIVAQVGGALDAAHAVGLVHRDVKPANILLGHDDHAYLTDFGLTKRAAASGGLTEPGGWVGTLGFVAPEQIRGERVDARTDVYALGCVLLFALTGTVPYARDGAEAMLWAHLHAPAPSDEVPSQFAWVVERALAKDPAARFASAGEFRHAVLAAARRHAGSVPAGRGPRAGALPPAGAPSHGPARPTIAAYEGDTRASTLSDAAAPARRGRSARRAASAARGALLAAGMLLAATLRGDAPARTLPQPRAAPAPAAASTRGSHDPVAAPPVRLAAAPDDLAVAGGRVWVLSSAAGVIDVLDAATGRPDDRVDIGASASGGAIAAGFDSVWAVKASTHALVRIGAQADRRHLDTATTLITNGIPTTIATGEHAVWVGVRSAGVRDGTGESLIRVDPTTLRQQQIPVAGGVRDVAVGDGAVWVAGAATPTVLRIDAANVSDRAVVDLPARPTSISVGWHGVWVTTSGSDALADIDPRTLHVRSITLRRRPERVRAGGGAVWATAPATRDLIRIDPRTMSVLSTTRTAAGAAGIWLTRDHGAWLTEPTAMAVQRVQARS